MDNNIKNLLESWKDRQKRTYPKEYLIALRECTFELQSVLSLEKEI